MIRMRYIGEGKCQAINRSDRLQCEELAFGTVLDAEPVKPRSRAQHNWWFAHLDDVWETLPDELQARFPEVEALRKHLLIKAGWCNCKEFAADTPEAAAAIAAALQWTEPYSAVVIRDNVVFAYVAKSQKIKAQNRKEFMACIDLALNHLALMLGVKPDTLRDKDAA